MTTTARTFTDSSAQFYLPNGTPFYEVPYADPKKGMRRATLADARKVGALPGPTTILKCLAKPELQNWITEQAILATETTPKLPQECEPPCPTCGHAKLKDLDAFIHRVLHVEKIQDQERDTAADKGKGIHDACARYFTGQDVPEAMRPIIMPAVTELTRFGQLVAAEKVLIGDGYGGRTDLILETPECFWIIDYKSTSTLPEKGAYKGDIIQLSAYAAAFSKMLLAAGSAKNVHTANCYISRTEPGRFVVWKHDEPWEQPYNCAFIPLRQLWCWMNNYQPQQV